MKSQPSETGRDPVSRTPAAPGAGTRARPRPLRELTGPVRGRLAVAVGLQSVAALAGVVPFIAVSEIADRLTADAPADGDTLWPLVALACAAGLLALACGTAA
ncbi:ABC transporter ATP-binding protein, partial [Streptomyces sp. SID5914]|nr:ABC transporter ATP-binding protein [Streptomyces sp. SID5914]